MNSESLLITFEYVRQSLDDLIHPTVEAQFNPLQSLQIVEDRILSDDFTFFEYPRRFALSEILISSIEELYRYHRAINGFPDTITDLNIVTAKILIAQDALTQSANLVGLSWLYFHYVKTSMHFSQQVFSKLANLDERTIRRYQNNAIEQLVKYLIQREQNARQNSFVNRLYSFLPHRGKEISVFGREQEIDLIKRNTNNHIHVNGSPGIGKTTFVEYVVREAINNKTVDQLVWLDFVPNIDYLRNYLLQKVIGENSAYTLETFLLLKRVIIVLDNSDSLFNNIPMLQELLHEYSRARIFLVTSLFHAPLPDCEYILLKELTPPSVEMLIKATLDSEASKVEFGYPTEIRDWVGGNPLAIKIFLQYRSLYSASAASKFTVEQLYEHQFSRLDSSSHLAWLLVSLNIDNRLYLDLLSGLDLPILKFQDFITLIQLHILEDHSGQLNISAAACQFIRIEYSVNHLLQHSLVDLLNYTDYLLENSEHLSLTLIEIILPMDWVIIDQSIKLYVANLLWPYGLRQGHYAQWHFILGEYEDEIAIENINLLIGYGICLRLLGDFKKSYNILISVVEFCGLNGLFQYQCEALLEICILLRLTSKYKNASNFMMHAKTVSKTLKSPMIDERILVEEIEYAVETNNWKFAQAKLFDLPDDHPHKTILMLEISINLEWNKYSDYQLDTVFSNFMEHAKENTPTLARVHALMGRIYEKRQQLNLAIRHFVAALALLDELDNDPFALARTQVNLAATLIASNQLTQVRDLISAAEHTQRIIGDQIGLVTTFHNAKVLERKIVG